MLQWHFSGYKKNRHLSGNYAPVHQEFNPYPLPVTGALPSVLAGEFVRNGPNPLFVPKGGYHWFDGDGMLHGVRITKDGKASYINRYTKTHVLEQEKKVGVMLHVRIGELFGKIGLVKVLFMMMKRKLGLIAEGGTANTALLYHNNKLQALVESDLPYEIRMLRDGQLETVGRMDYGGKISAMTAHPKVDPVTNELFFFSYGIYKAPFLTYSFADPKGNVVRTFPIDLSEPVMMHDFAITDRHAIFLDLSLTFNPKRLLKGNMVSFDPNHKARVGILNRYAKNPDGIVWFPVPPNVVFHTVNAWEEEDEVVLITCKVTSDYEMRNILGTDFGLVEWRFNMKTKAFTEEQIIPGIWTEFPQINHSCLGRKNKYVFTATGTSGKQIADTHFTGLLKIDIETREIVGTFTYGVNKFGSEGVFVPKENPKSEDDGYLLTFVYDATKNISSFWVIDAKTMSDIVAIVDLPQRVPYGFHGIFVSEKEIQAQL